MKKLFLFLMVIVSFLILSCEQGLGESSDHFGEQYNQESPKLTSIYPENIDGISKSISTGNNYPIILLHGFAGWGEEELLEYNYWGGFNSIKEYLTNEGHETLVATVGPFSSNWDRACELYAFIKGNTVDYGKVHSELHGHDRFGRTFEGIYPEWNSENPIHIIGHSMGGQTMRVLINLLNLGDENEFNGTEEKELSSLFAGGKDWVKAAVSIATPHDGTTLTEHVTTLIPMAQDMAAAISVLVDGNFMYDFKLDQWGLTKKEDETDEEFIERVKNSSIWNGSKDTCLWDLSRPGAEELNEAYPSLSNIYYFSLANECTYKGLFSRKYYPRVYMNPVLQPFAFSMGQFDAVNLRETDGLVNVISMDGPLEGSNDNIENFDGNAKKGIWNYLGKQNGWDHLAIVGMFDFSVDPMFLELAELLHSLQ